MEIFSPSRTRCYLFKKSDFECDFAQQLWNDVRYILRIAHSYLEPDRTKGAAIETLSRLRSRIASVRRRLAGSQQFDHSHLGEPCSECRRVSESGVVNRSIAVAEDIATEKEQLIREMVTNV